VIPGVTYRRREKRDREIER